VNILVIVLAIWTIPWKIYAIWTAVKNDHKKWFVAILLLNTVSILELYYVFKVANKSQAEVKAAFKGAWDSIFNKNKTN
jgi:hypothetical protein